MVVDKASTCCGKSAECVCGMSDSTLAHRLRNFELTVL